MLKQLTITNIVLIQNAAICLRDGFNVLSGETGSGKSAIMEALSLLTGAKADSNLLRHGMEKGCVEALFNIDQLSRVKTILENAGIEHIEGEHLIVKREIASMGKSRAFINNQQAHLVLLKQLGEQLVTIVGQHANQKLLHLDHHRSIVDLFGDIEESRELFAKSWEEENQTRAHLDELISNEANRLKEIEIGLQELKELEEANLKNGEEEELFAEYNRLSHAEELAKDAVEIYERLLMDEGVLPALSRLLKTYDKLVSLDSSLEASRSSYKEAIEEIKEGAHLLRNYHSKIEHNPERIEEINARLTLIDRIKRKYGPTLQQAIDYRDRLKEKMKLLEQADVMIEDLQKKLQIMEIRANQLAKDLTEKRKQASKKLEKALLGHLRPLNMPKADFFVNITPHIRSGTGDDCVEFFFSPNVGEKRIAIKDCASGGELSRLMLALQALLVGKEAIPTLVFDEIDANVGGETASVVGEKLREIGSKHQVLCITHFPQVAKCAAHHIQIYKEEKNGRTVTSIQVLDSESRKKELSRMAGG